MATHSPGQFPSTVPSLECTNCGTPLVPWLHVGLRSPFVVTLVIVTSWGMSLVLLADDLAATLVNLSTPIDLSRDLARLRGSCTL